MVMKILVLLPAAAAAGVTSVYVRGPGAPQIIINDASGGNPAPAPTAVVIPAGAPLEQRKITHVAAGFVVISWVSSGDVAYDTVFWGSGPSDITEVAVEDSPATSYTCEDEKCGGPGYV
jgi:hypothetical protein